MKIIIPSPTSLCNVVPHFELPVGTNIKHHNLQWCGVGGAWIVLFAEVTLNEDGASLFFSPIERANNERKVWFHIAVTRLGSILECSVFTCFTG